MRERREQLKTTRTAGNRTFIHTSVHPGGGGGKQKKNQAALEHSEDEEKPRRQMAESISPIRRSYFSCHARACEDAVSITEQLLLLFGPALRSRPIRLTAEPSQNDALLSPPTG